MRLQLGRSSVRHHLQSTPELVSKDAWRSTVLDSTYMQVVVDIFQGDIILPGLAGRLRLIESIMGTGKVFPLRTIREKTGNIVTDWIRPHIHVATADGECKFWFDRIKLARNKNIKPHIIRDIERLVYENQDMLKKAYNEYHGYFS